MSVARVREIIREELGGGASRGVGMAVTLAELAAALRLGDGVTEPVEHVAGILLRLQRAAEALIEEVAPAAPAAIKQVAMIDLVAYWFDAPTASSGSGYAAALRNSGAQALISRWEVRRAVGVEVA